MRALDLDPDATQQQVFDLIRALRGMVAAAGDVSLANREEALANARRVLARVTPRASER